MSLSERIGQRPEIGLKITPHIKKQYNILEKIDNRRELQPYITFQNRNVLHTLMQCYALLNALLYI